MTQIKIDLNSDLGESPDSYDVDAELMRFITSANIACGGHAGDAESVRRTVQLARSHGVAIGAHPSFPDRANFGRLAMTIDPAELQRSIEEQIRLVAEVAARLDLPVAHVKPHGALYHSASADAAVAQAIARAVRKVTPSAVVVAQCGSRAVECYADAGLLTASEAFADRAYEPDGTLRSRTLPGALLDEDRAVEQALNIVLKQQVVASDGNPLNLRADTLCFHSDTPNAAAIAERVREALESARVRIAPLRQP
jgi:5-oxoprolinase (ATP-hydrolysing) subunit A